MLTNNKTFSSFSVADLKQAQNFYGQTLGLEMAVTPEGLDLHLAGGARAFIYPKANHAPATFTVLNFQVRDIEQTVDELKKSGVNFEQYDAPGIR
jgi:hypothetical protein